MTTMQPRHIKGKKDRMKEKGMEGGKGLKLKAELDNGRN